MDLSQVKTRSALALLFHLYLDPDSTLAGDALCRHLGIKSRSSLSEARRELESLGLLGRPLLVEPEPEFAPEDEDDALDAEADRIDSLLDTGNRRQNNTPAKNKNLLTVHFFARAWKQLLPSQPALKKRRVEEIVRLAEQSTQAGIRPAALLLKVIRIIADRKPKQLTISYIMTIVRGEGNGTPPPNWQPRPAKPVFQPKPGEAATEEEARVARAAAARREVEQIKALTRGVGPRKIGLIDDEEE